MSFETIQDDGKFRIKRARDGINELVVPFDSKGRAIRIQNFWILYDYATGVDAVVEPNNPHDLRHKLGLDRVVDRYFFELGHRGEGFKIHVIGVASAFKRSASFDNDALASRRGGNAMIYLGRSGVDANDVSDLHHAVRGKAEENLPQDRSVAISTGLCASNVFEIWFAGKDSLGVDLICVRAVDWGLETIYRVAPQKGSIDLSTALPSRGSGPGLQMLTGIAGEMQGRVPISAFHFSMANFTRRGEMTTIGGFTGHENVRFDGVGTNAAPAKSRAPSPLAQRALTASTSSFAKVRLGPPLVPDNPGPGPLIPDEEMTALLLQQTPFVRKAS